MAGSIFEPLTICLEASGRLFRENQFPGQDEWSDLKSRSDEILNGTSEWLRKKMLSDAAEPVLQRHLHFLLTCLNHAALQLPDVRQSGILLPELAEWAEALEERLVKLTGAILDNCREAADGIPAAYPAFVRHQLRGSASTAMALLATLERSPSLDGLKGILYPVLHLILHPYPSTNVSYSYVEVFYIDQLARSLSPLSQLPPEAQENFLCHQLARCNFNHLGFLYYLQQKARSDWNGLTAGCKRDFILDRMATLQVDFVGAAGPYDPLWPDLRVMLACWLREQLAQQTQDQGHQIISPPEKICLNTSVAHLACFLRAFQAGGLLTLPASDLFRWIAAHCRTKRQQNISAGSLGKEFYSINQFTAARVREQLVKAAAGITSHYFPVMAAIYLASHWCAIS